MASATQYRDRLLAFRAPTLRTHPQGDWDLDSSLQTPVFPLHLADRHLPLHLVLKRVEVLPSLAHDLCQIIDDDSERLYALADGEWAFPSGAYSDIDAGDAREIAKLREEAVNFASCRVVSSTLLHPSQHDLLPLLSWTLYPAMDESFLYDKFACQDRILGIQEIGDSPLWANLSRDTRALVKDLATHTPWLGSGMFFNNEGEEILRNMSSHEHFPWKFDSQRDKAVASKASPILVDADSAIWRLPEGTSKTPTVRRSRRVTEKQESLRVAPASSLESPAWLGELDPNGEYVPLSEDYIQKAWSAAVRVDASAILFDCGNFIRVGIRRRSSQTLFLSDIVDATTSDNPSYGKICTAFHYASLLDALDRLPSLQATAEIRNNRSKRKATMDRTESRKRMKLSDDAAGDLEIKTLDHISSHSIIALSLQFDDLDSPAPILMSTADSLLRLSKYAPDEYLKVVLSTRLGAGAVGDAFRAIIEPDRAASLAQYSSFVVKMASEISTVERLEHEHRVYQRLRDANTQGVPTLMGFYENKNATLAILLLSYVGIPLAERMEGGQVLLPPDQCAGLRRILRDIHKAGVLHRDIRSWNLTEDHRGRVYIVDFDRASLKATKQDFSDEKKRLNRFLDGMFVDNEQIIGEDDIVNA